MGIYFARWPRKGGKLFRDIYNLQLRSGWYAFCCRIFLLASKKLGNEKANRANREYGQNIFFGGGSGNQPGEYQDNVKPPLVLPEAAPTVIEASPPKSGAMYHSEVTHVSVLVKFIHHNGDVNAIVTGGLSVVLFVICVTGMLLIGVGLLEKFWPLTLLSFAMILVFAFFSLYFAFYVLNDVYVVYFLRW